MGNRYSVIDLFAGPGGLGEGFAGLSIGERHPFQIVLSAEMEAAAHSTLRLRAFLRAYLREEGRLPPRYAEFHAGRIPVPDWAAISPALWTQAEREAQRLTLGSIEAQAPLAKAISKAQSSADDTVLLGGPPCQAYSLVGRARNRGVVGYRAEDDHRHFLFRQYIEVLRQLRPAAFVMENVKGFLSAAVSGRGIFDMLMEDLSSLAGDGHNLYELVPLCPLSLLGGDPRDFVVCSEDHGVPQRRHRVIILGIRHDVARRLRRSAHPVPALPRTAPQTTVRQAIGDLPRLRSGLSREHDDLEAWRDAVRDIAAYLAELSETEEALSGNVQDVLSGLPRRVAASMPVSRSASARLDDVVHATGDLASFLYSPGLIGIAQHETRGHIRPDLARYMFAAAWAEGDGRSPKARDFPDELAPTHRNWSSGKFADRFRVQLWDEPATTVTSHIAKDGHYFIHPDPLQCRSLTVREAARLQAFPDDYLFLGNRTQQYVQVGNAVPPYLARQIARFVHSLLTANPDSKRFFSEGADADLVCQT